jgi:hypothetical protein
VEFKYRLHSLLTQEPDLLASLRAEAMAVTYPPCDAVELAWREGYRAKAAEWMSIYDEVENEQRTARLGN